MALVNWLPIGFNLPDGSHTKQALYEGPGWQIIDTASGKRALLAKEDLAQRWINALISLFRSHLMCIFQPKFEEALV